MEKDAADAVMRLQIAMWLKDYPHEDPQSSCAVCRRPYKSVDDFIERNPRAALGFHDADRPDRFVDEACWAAYAKDHEEELAVKASNTAQEDS